MTFSLPGELTLGRRRYIYPPSQNVWQRLHWRVRSAIQRWADMQVISVACAGLWKRQSGKTVVSVEIRRKRLVDPDALGSGCKTIMDALRHASMLADDDAKHVDLRVTQSQVKPYGAIVTLEIPEKC